jgi:predicted nucleic acid-binding protein
VGAQAAATAAPSLIHLDTSLLVEALTAQKRSAVALRRVLERGERMTVSTLVLYEWLRGPREDSELADQQGLFPTEQAVVFGPREAVIAATLYRNVPRARDREFDLAVAACALTHGAALWTLNRADFHDIPDLMLFEP